ncbi:hypothetical protein AAG589_19350 [Isoptericola sp. F-RaC21]|uniref:hypothetical protein n=1 Tax=Isoptericola sp. F-RaC21 TaxID=3141452 RepID=UPI00315BC2F4
MPRAQEVAEVVALLESWGATPLPVGTFEANLFDEYVEEDLVVHQASIDDERLIASRLTPDEREAFLPEAVDDDDPEPLVDGDDEGWGALADGLDSARRVIVVLERDRSAPQRVGNFRVHGAGQWIRESLWAATGVLPRDPGSCGTGLYAQALDLARPERPDVPVSAYDRLPGRLWTVYVAFQRPRWRRARRRHLGADVGRDGSMY